MINEIKVFYDGIWHRGTSEHLEDVRRHSFHSDSLHYALAQLGALQGLQVLEFGPGRGLEAISMAKRGAKVVAADLSEVGLRRVRQYAQRYGLEDRVIPLQTDAHRAGLATASFDRIFAQTMLMHTQVERVVDEAVRLLRPGGYAVFLEPLNGHPLIALYRTLASPYREIRPRYVHWCDLADWGQRFKQWTHREFYLFSVLGLPFVGKRGHIPRWLWWLRSWDSRLLSKRPLLGRWAWVTVFVGKV